MMKTNTLVLATLAIVLIAVVYLTLDLHWDSQRQALALYQRNQLLTARQAAGETEGHLLSLTRELHALSVCPLIQNFDPKETPLEVEPCFQKLQESHVSEISVADETGTTLYSTDRKKLAGGRIDPGIAKWAAQPANKGRTYTAISGKRADNEVPEQPSLLLIVAVPVYRGTAGARQAVQEKFAGTLSMTVDLERLLGDHLSLADSGVQAQAWLMGEDGTLLFHSEHPEMTMRNIGRTDQSCGSCHLSMDHVRKILAEKQGTVDYAVRNFPEKLCSLHTAGLR